MPETLIIVGGAVHLAVFAYHLMFWRLFDWKTDLATLTPTNRNVIQILNLCLMFVFLLFSYLSLAYFNELIRSQLGNVLLIAISLFWFLRAIQQVYFFDLRTARSQFILAASLMMCGLYLIPIANVVAV